MENGGSKMEFNFKRKSDVQIALDELKDGVTKRLYEQSGYTAFYYMGIMQYLYELALTLGDKYYLTKDDLLAIIKSFSDNDDTPEDVKKISVTMLDELSTKYSNDILNGGKL